MQIRTSRFGRDETVDVSEDQIYEFQPGLSPFTDYHRYALLAEDDSPVEWLQSVDDPAVGFPLLEPFLFYPHYAFELTDGDAAALGLDAPEAAVVRCILTVRDEADGTTANLLAPIVLNEATHRGRQVVLQQTALPLRFPVFDQLTLPASA